MNIYGGYFSVQKAYNGKYYVLNVKNGSNGVIHVYGGSFENQDPSKGDDAGAPASFLAAGSKVFAETSGSNTIYRTYAVPTTADAFAKALANGGDIMVEKGTTIDLSQYNGGNEIKVADGTVLTVHGTLNTARAQLGIYNGTFTVIGNIPAGKGLVNEYQSPEQSISTLTEYGVVKSEGIAGAKGNRPLNAYNNATLIVKNLHVTAEQNNGGSCIYSEGGNLIIDNSIVNGHNFCVGANGATLKATNSTFNSDSSNKEGSWSYTVDVASGCQGLIENCRVNGIQGGITVEGKNSVVTINNTSSICKSHPEYPVGQTAFWPIYATNLGVAIVNSGNFYTDADNVNKYGAQAGDNDVNMPDGNLVLKGGKFSKEAWNNSLKQIVQPAQGYVYKAIEGDDMYTVEVVKE